MRNFGEAYKSVIKDLPEFHLEAAMVTDEIHHRKMASARRRKTWISAAAAACVFLVCGAGAAAAMNYHASVIEISQNGFSFTNQKSGSGADEKGYNEEEGGLSMASARDMGEAAAGAAEQGAGEMPDGIAMQSMDDKTDGADRGIEESIPAEAGEDAAILEAQVMEPEKYDSIDEYCRQTDTVVAIPELSWLGDADTIERQEVLVLSEMNSIIITVSFPEDLCFSLHQTDTRESLGYASSSAFMGTAVNERTFTNSQGFVYQVFDSEEEGEITSTHAAISVNGRDLTLNFFGFGEETVESVLGQLDLSVYFAD